LREFPYPVLYRSNRFLVIDKPTGVPVHPGPRGAVSIEDSFPALRRKGHDGPWLAHRLDADTSGCLVIALRKQALVAAQACFAEGRASKTYWAVVEGGPDGEEGVMETGLLRRSDRLGWRMVVDPAGDRAVTRWRVLGREGGRSWLALELLTGRTHQARVHCASLGCPILGDPVYGREGGGLHLLSRRLVMEAGERIVVEAPPHGEMARMLAGFGWTGVL